MKKNLILTILKWLWIVVVVVAAGYFFYRNIDKFTEYIKDLSILPLVISFLLITLGKIILADFTRLSLKKIDTDISLKDAINVTGMTQLGKYIPGGVWQFAGKLGVYKVRGINLKLAAKAMILENFWLLSSALAIGVYLILQFDSQLICGYIKLFCASQNINIAKILIIIVWLVSTAAIDKFLFRSKKKTNPINLIHVILDQILTWVLSGISFWVLFNGQNSLSSIFLFIGAFSVSWAAGFVIFFASGGIGIRELFLTLTLSTLLPAEQILIIASIHRLLWVLSDLFVGLGSGLIFGMPVTEDSNSVE